MEIKRHEPNIPRGLSLARQDLGVKGSRLRTIDRAVPRLHEIGGIEAFREPAIDLREQPGRSCACLGAATAWPGRPPLAAP